MPIIGGGIYDVKAILDRPKTTKSTPKRSQSCSGVEPSLRLMSIPRACAPLAICSGGEITWSIVIDQMIKRIFEVSGGDLFLEVDGDELALHMGIRLVSGHGYSLWDGLK